VRRGRIYMVGEMVTCVTDEQEGRVIIIRIQVQRILHCN
jgi:hypothetical protein